MYWKPSPTVSQTNENINSSGREDETSRVYPSVSGRQRHLLPIAKHRRQILYAVEHNSVTVLVGETGCGKSTQLPQYLAENGWCDHEFCVACTEPRRWAAMALAQRVAEESLLQVAYAVRFDDKSTSTTQIKYITDGRLLQQAVTGDPLLAPYSVIVVDEAHERTLHSDALLGLLHKIRQQRTQLRLVICSATLDAQRFLDFFLQNRDATKDKRNDTDFLSTGTIISVDGRQYPVDIMYLQQPALDYLIAMVETVWNIHSMCANDPDEQGDVLCFLPSSEDIDRAIRLAEEYFDQQQQEQQGHNTKTRERNTKHRAVDFLPLYGTLPYQMQARIFQQPDRTSSQNKKRPRRIIFATNLAETSVSVPCIRYVVDSGLVKLPYFDPVAGLERLVVGPISRASAQQRAGRAGRLFAGQCYRLYTEPYLHTTMVAETQPEILRTNVTSFLLTLKSLGVDNLLAFELMDTPSVEALQHGLESLHVLGAIDETTQLTSLGLDLASFPVEPRVARMLLQSLSEDCSWPVLAVASIMQVHDVLQPPRSSRPQAYLDYEASVTEFADPSGDHVTYANLMSIMDDLVLSEQDCRNRFVNYFALRRALEIRKQLARSLRPFGVVQATVQTDEAQRSKSIRRCLTAAFFGNTAKLGNDGRYYTLRSQVLVTPCSNSVLTTHSQFSSEYIIFGETMDSAGGRGGIELKNCSAVEAQWLRELAPHYWE